MIAEMYRMSMTEVGVAQFRRELKTWLQRVGEGDEVIITDRGRPVGRLVGAGATSRLDDLVAAGTLSKPAGRRPRAVGRDRVEADPGGTDDSGSVSDAIIAERDHRRS